MPTSEPRGRAALRLCRAGAVALAYVGSAASADAPLAGEPVAGLSVQGDALTIRGPVGFCVDPSATRDDAAGAFVLLGDCTRLDSDARVSPVMPAVLTVLVSGPGSERQRPSPEQLDRFVRSEAGRAALSLDGEADTVTILQTRIAGDLLLFQMRDQSTARPAALSEVSWRAIMTLRERLVSLGVTAQRPDPIDERAQQVLLNAFVARMLGENADGAAPEG